MNKQWHILYTNPRAEKRVLSYLQKYNFECYLPIITVKTKWSDRWKMVEKPMFTSYVFVKISYWDDKNKILILPGIHNIVFYKGEPATLDEEIIDTMKILVTNFSEKIQIIKDFQLFEGDTGSPEVQVALLTASIQELTEHLKQHKKDDHSRRGLLKQVAKRRRLLNFLLSRSEERYQKLITVLELSK